MSDLLSKIDLGILNWRPNSQPLRLLWQPHIYRLSTKFPKKSQKMSNLLSTIDLGILNWRPNSQPLRLLWQPHIYRLGNSNFEKKFHKIFLKKSQKTSYLENCKVLGSHIWRQNSQLLRVPWQSLTTEIVFSSYIKFFIPKIWKILRKSKKKSYLENYKTLSRHIQGRVLQPPESTLTDSNNRIDIFRVLEFFNI